MLRIINDGKTLNKIYLLTYLLTNPFNAKISFEAYLHIPVSKAEEGNYESYNLQGVYFCTLSLTNQHEP
jgi:hypothetical protein